VTAAPAIGAAGDVSVAERVIWRPASVGGGKVKLMAEGTVGVAGEPEPRFTWAVVRVTIGEGQADGAASGAGAAGGAAAGEMSAAGWVTGFGLCTG